jgi:hypothetical protein
MSTGRPKTQTPGPVFSGSGALFYAAYYSMHRQTRFPPRLGSRREGTALLAKTNTPFGHGQISLRGQIEHIEARIVFHAARKRWQNGESLRMVGDKGLEPLTSRV